MGWFDDWFKETVIPFIASTATGGISDVGYAADKGGDVFDFVDRAIDPGGMIDTGFRRQGEVLPPWLRKAAPGVAGGIGGYLYGPGGAAAGAGLGSKIAGQDTQSGFQNAGMAAIAAYLAGGGKSGNGSEMNGLQASTADIAPPAGYNESLGPYVTGGSGGLMENSPNFNVDFSLGPELAAYDASTTGISPPLGYKGELGKYVTGANSIPYGQLLKAGTKLGQGFLAGDQKIPELGQITPVSFSDYAYKRGQYDTVPDYAKTKEEKDEKEKKEEKGEGASLSPVGLDPADRSKKYLDYTTLSERLKEILRRNPSLYA